MKAYQPETRLGVVRATGDRQVEDWLLCYVKGSSWGNENTIDSDLNIFKTKICEWWWLSITSLENSVFNKRKSPSISCQKEKKKSTVLYNDYQAYASLLSKTALHLCLPISGQIHSLSLVSPTSSWESLLDSFSMSASPFLAALVASLLPTEDPAALMAPFASISPITVHHVHLDSALLSNRLQRPSPIQSQSLNSRLKWRHLSFPCLSGHCRLADDTWVGHQSFPWLDPDLPSSPMNPLHKFSILNTSWTFLCPGVVSPSPCLNAFGMPFSPNCCQS